MGSIRAVIIVINKRKMCVVVPHILARGPLRAPVASPRLWRLLGIETIHRQQNVSPFHHSQALEKSLSTCTEPWTNGWPSDHQSGEHVAAPPDTPTTISWRPGREHFIAALASEPSH
jgi:hypothetical protein